MSSLNSSQLFDEFGVIDYEMGPEMPEFNLEEDSIVLGKFPSFSQGRSCWFDKVINKPFYSDEPSEQGLAGAMEAEGAELDPPNLFHCSSSQHPIQGLSSQHSQPIADSFSEETLPHEPKKSKKREENTILRVVLTSIRDHLKSKGFVKRAQGDAQLLQKIPGTKPGIEQLFSYLELNPNTCDFKESLLSHRHQLRQKGLVYHTDQPDRQASFYEHFDLVFDALESAKNYKDRLNLIFKSRSHSKQLKQVELFRMSIRQKFNC